MGMTNGLLVNSAMSTATSLIGKKVEAYAPVEKTDGESSVDNSSEDSDKKTLTGVVEGVHMKDGIVYMDIRVDETKELKSIEYAALIKVSDNNTNTKK